MARCSQTSKAHLAPKKKLSADTDVTEHGILIKDCWTFWKSRFYLIWMCYSSWFFFMLGWINRFFGELRKNCIICAWSGAALSGCHVSDSKTAPNYYILMTYTFSSLRHATLFLDTSPAIISPSTCARPPGDSSAPRISNAGVIKSPDLRSCLWFSPW